MKLLDETGSPIEFQFKELLLKSRKMVSETHPDRVLYFDKEYEGILNFIVDYEKGNLYFSRMLLDCFKSVYNLKNNLEVYDELDEILLESFKGIEFSDLEDSITRKYEELYFKKQLKTKKSKTKQK
jgi:hypothetical protein